MSEYNMSHTGAQLDAAIKKVNDGYFLSKYTSGSITLSSDNVGVQTTCESSKLKISVGFKPKLFLFRPYSYEDGKILCKYDSSYNIISSSYAFFDGLNQTEISSATFFLTKLTATSPTLSTTVTITGGESTVSVGNTGFRLNPNNPMEVYWHIISNTYKIRAGTWFWEAYA